MIIHRYLLRETLQAFAAVLAVLLLIYISNRFVRYLAQAASGAISGDLIAELMLLKVLANLALLIPISLFIAVLLALGRLYKDSEVTAMTAGGVGMGQIAGTMFWIALAFAGLTLGLSLYVAPTVEAAQSELLVRAKQESQISGIFPGRFREFSDGNQTIYVEHVAADQRSVGNVFVQIRKPGKQELLVSRSAHQRIRTPGDYRYIVLENGHRYTGEPGSGDYVITRFDRHAVLLEIGGVNPDARRLDAHSTLELLASDRSPFSAELHWRLAQPISVVLLAVLAVPLARTSPRQGKYAKLFTAFLIYFGYTNTLGIARNLIERGQLPSLIGMWPIHILLALVVLGTLYVQSNQARSVSWLLKNMVRRR